jgi:xanthine phosphoribosyltransferase
MEGACSDNERKESSSFLKKTKKFTNKQKFFGSFFKKSTASFLLLMKPAYATVTWDQLHRDGRSLAAAAMARGPFQGIVAISRGGLIPAAIVARELEIRLVECLSVITYAEEAGSNNEPRIIKPAAAAGDGEGFLIVDDLVDRGDTARTVRAALPRALFACLYAKPAGRPLTDLFVAEVPQDTWLLFPWDTAPLFVPPLARKG